jgi:hypothetical protein
MSFSLVTDRCHDENSDRTLLGRLTAREDFNEGLRLLSCRVDVSLILCGQTTVLDVFEKPETGPMQGHVCSAPSRKLAWSSAFQVAIT